MTAQQELPIFGVREGGLLFQETTAECHFGSGLATASNAVLPMDYPKKERAWNFQRSKDSQKKMHEVVLLDDPSSLTKKKKSSNEEGRIRVTVVSNKDGQKPLELVITCPIVVSQSRLQVEMRWVSPVVIATTGRVVEKPLPNEDLYIRSFLGDFKGEPKQVLKLAS